MKIIGLTGGIASGKTTVATHLRRLGAPVLDADVIARQVVEPGQQAWREIRQTFGPGVFLSDGKLDRAALGALVFADPTSRQQLNQIVHPQVQAVFQREIERLRAAGHRLVVLDIPLLLETGMDCMVDEVWVVAADEATQVQRLQLRDKLDEQAARSRIAAQMSLADKLKRADQVIDGQAELEVMLQQVEQLWKEKSL
ncbi:dephospho-CoA kinase [Heliophilum fasciatum]|uniref:Dephospho-CoA kinase n=1 Tax=Heliophilum fasciatum TaxID=35700 RepID=A0A4R2RWP9_9FIRM|nr:dephospho-CoA kinase [Heliophilum fasciatum]MCW2276727.1 dephospho-CoA kinase [Heliophilum fasciatum]TCP68892.1 dephospho-CoA kinase [Heliophilum fasciatum]